MIFMYNEAEYPVWDITEKNDNFIRIRVKGDGKHTFGIDLVKKNISMSNFFLDILDNVCTNTDNGFSDVWAAADIKFAMCYNNHSGMPFLKQSTDDSKGLDLYLITYVKTKAMELISERSRRFNVIYTTEEPGKNDEVLVHIIATAKMDNEPFLYLTYRWPSIYEDETWLYETKHIITNKAKEDVSVFIRDYHEKEVNSSKYSKSILGNNQPGSAIKLAKTVIPYSVIIYPFSIESVRTDLCEKRYNKRAQYTKYINSEIVAKNLMTEIKKIRSEKYTAATFYIDKPFDTVSVEDMKSVPGMDMFQRVNFLCQDGKVKSL